MALFKNISLLQLWQGAVNTFLRFPMVLLSAIAGTAAVISQIELTFEQRQQNVWLTKLIFVCAIGLILFFTLELIVRRYKLVPKWRVFTWLGGVAFLSLYFAYLPDELETKHMLRFLALMLALHLAASYAMFINRQEENAFWQFNKALFLRILTSVLYSGVLYVGLTVAIVALDQLFSVNISQEIYSELWFFMVGVFNTWFFLAGVPTDLHELEHTHTYPKGLKVFTQFVLLPLVTIYLLILYAYFGKIVVQWEWPEGWVSVLVLCFSIAGILSLLLIHPIRNVEGTTWVRTFSKWFYRALFPLVILLTLAIWRRVSEYGITEERYIVVVLAMWLLVTALYFLFSRVKNIKFIPVTLSVVAIIAAFGPVNMFVVSEWSQVNRLRELLQEQGLLVDNIIQPDHKPVEQDALVEISSITDYLSEHHDFESLEDWFESDLTTALDSAVAGADNKWRRNNAARDQVLSLMGLEYTSATNTSNTHYYNFVLNGYDSNGQAYAIAGYDYAVDAYFRGDDNRQELKLGQVPLIVTLKGNKLHFQLEQEALQLDLVPAIKKLSLKDGSIRTADELTFNLLGKQTRVKVVLEELSGFQKKDKYTISDTELLIFISLIK